MPYFLIFALKNRLWVLVRTVTIHVLSKNKKKCHNFSSENYDFYSRENCSLLHGRVFVMCTNFDQESFHSVLFTSHYQKYRLTRQNNVNWSEKF